MKVALGAESSRQPRRNWGTSGCHVTLYKRPHSEFGVLHAACDKTLGVVKAFGHHLGDVLAALFSFIMREASELSQQKHNIRANKKQGLKTHRLQPLTVQILTDCSKIGFPLREINKPTLPDRYKSRAAHRRHKNRAPSCDFRYAKAPRAGPCGCFVVRATRSPDPTASRRAHRARRGT